MENNQFYSVPELVDKLSGIIADMELSGGNREKISGMKKALKIVVNFPKVNTTPVKKGFWKTVMMSEATGWDLSLTGGRDVVCEYVCSVCGEANYLNEFGEAILSKYCPFCGAILSEDDQNELSEVDLK